jgi:carbon dioxide concentrating mechanism protein CcmN
MALQPLQFVEIPQVQMIGDVTIHPSAAIAPGTILRADPDSQIVIGAGVCLGMGVVIHAYGGAIAIEVGANLGAGVLIVGTGTIGANACIGGATTIFKASVKPLQVVPAGAVLGDTSRHLEEEEEIPEPDVADLNGHVESRAEDPWSEMLPEPPEEPKPSSPKASEDSQKNEAPQPPGNPVYGQVRVNQLLFTLFPHKGNSTNPPPS